MLKIFAVSQILHNTFWRHLSWRTTKAARGGLSCEGINVYYLESTQTTRIHDETGMSTQYIYWTIIQSSNYSNMGALDHEGSFRAKWDSTSGIYLSNGSQILSGSTSLCWRECIWPPSTVSRLCMGFERWTSYTKMFLYPRKKVLVKPCQSVKCFTDIKTDTPFCLPCLSTAYYM